MHRRRALRRRPAPDEPITRARLRTGGELTVIDVSDCGCLAETTECLRPGRQLHLHLLLAGARVLVRARVMRAYVSAIRRDAIRYRVALAFDWEIDTRAAPVSR